MSVFVGDKMGTEEVTVDRKGVCKFPKQFAIKSDYALAEKLG
jgi:hypothetical protein